MTLTFLNKKSQSSNSAFLASIKPLALSLIFYRSFLSLVLSLCRPVYIHPAADQQLYMTWSLVSAVAGLSEAPAPSGMIPLSLRSWAIPPGIQVRDNKSPWLFPYFEISDLRSLWYNSSFCAFLVYCIYVNIAVNFIIRVIHSTLNLSEIVQPNSSYFL